MPDLDALTEDAPDTESLPVRGRDMLRLVLLLALLLLWVIPNWTTARSAGSGYREVIGAVRTGAFAALALVVLWGLSATSLLTRRRRGMRAGMAWTHALTAGLMAALLFVEHPWIPGGDARAAWVPVFAPLALLAALDAWRTQVDLRHGSALALFRALGGIFAAVAFYVAGHPVPAGVAAWLGLSGLAVLGAGNALSNRRRIELLLFLAALVAGAAPHLHDALVLPADTRYLHSRFGAAGYAWVILSAVLATAGLDGLLRPSPLPPD